MSELFTRCRSLLARHYPILLVFLAGLALRLYMAQADPFLHDWDERFHALVAKNMMSHPFKPMLYVHQYFETDRFNWTYNHIWLHKQPLFMWQMALSMKLFGVSEFTMRLPSVIMGSLMILLTYRICLLATNNKWSALFAGILVCCSNYYLYLISGREGMDHNDIAFGFYVLASIWAYAELLRKATWKWAILIGLFAGCAILNKWLTGLLVFAPWGIQIVVDLVRTKKLKGTGHFLLALGTCAVVFLPWQIYILTAFKELANHEYAYNSKHIWEAVEGHGGDIWYYLNSFPDYFGWQVNYLVPLGLLIICFRKSITPKYKLVLVVPGILVFCFFSFLVQTKIKPYFFVAAPLCFIYSGVALQSIADLFGRFRAYAALPLLAIAIYFTLNFERLTEKFNDNGNWEVKRYNTAIYKRMDKIIPQSIKVLVNVNAQEHVDIMFYSNRLEAYHSHIPEEEFRTVTKNGMPVAAFPSRNNYQLDAYISTYKNLYIVPVMLK